MTADENPLRPEDGPPSSTTSRTGEAQHGRDGRASPDLLPGTPATDDAPSNPGSGAAEPGSKTQDTIKEIAEALARAEAMKPLEGPITDVYSPAADKAAARKKLWDAYKAAIDKDGPLWVKFEAARKRFERAALDMGHGADSVLDKWLGDVFGAKGALKALLDEREDLEPKFDTKKGREKARADADAVAKRWASRYADWSAPVDKVTALIGQYADKIDKLNADINNEVNLNAAMTAFWFEVAPRHLQLESALSIEMQKVVDTVASKLAGYKDLAGILTVGQVRKDGTLYVVLTADEAESKRKFVLDEWKKAAEALALADAAFKLDPDDLATFKQRWDKLKDDAWIAEAKKI